MRRDPLDYLSTELQALRDQGLYRRLRVLDDEQKARTSIDHRLVVNLSSNNYLGLTTHPKLRERAIEATRQLGVGSGSVRTIAGTMNIHMELERKLAAFKRTEAAVVFQSGFTANAGTVSSILGRDEIIISDELNHASIIDGARLSRATIKVFPHRDIAAARESVHIESFIWYDGKISRELARLLAAKARQGVEVRILVDASGGRQLKGEVKEMLEDAGAEPVSVFCTNDGHLAGCEPR